MSHFLRRCKCSLGSVGAVVAVSMGLVVALAPCAAGAQIGNIIHIMHMPNPIIHASSKVYLGVDLANVNKSKAQELKLKKARGVVVTLLDHDAPAAHAGIQVNDVILSLNGKEVKNVDQFWHMLYKFPAGRKVNMKISRDGSVQTMAVKLVNRRTVENDAWKRIGNGGDIFPSAPAAMGMFSGASTSPTSGGFHLPFFGSTLNVGALVEPLTSQMADYLGVASGLMVKQVARKSEAALAGMRAFDVILKIGSEKVTNIAGWDRALRANQGKPVQVTILRNRKQHVITLQVDSKHPQSKLHMEDLYPAGKSQSMATVDTAAHPLTR